MTADLHLLRALYRPATLPDLADRLASQLRELSARPTRDGCDLMVRELAEASTAVRQLRTSLEQGARE